MFRILTAQGPDAPGGAYDYMVKGRLLAGFALLAHPLRWGETGVMTFLCDQRGQVWERNLGKRTRRSPRRSAPSIRVRAGRLWRRTDARLPGSLARDCIHAALPGLCRCSAGRFAAGLLACRRTRLRPEPCCPSRRCRRRASPGRRCRSRSTSAGPSRTTCPADAPNILIVLLDDVGFGLPDTFGGEIATPTLTRLANEGISYNTFHTTAICSPTRAALLTGRNHQRVGSGTIAERAVDWDGYTGVIPKSSATIAEVLHEYGYKTAAFGKWHNTPATETTAMGPFDRWPTGYGFDYFYGFLAGETSQYEPRLFENTQRGRAAARSEIPPDRGHGRQGARLAAPAAGLRARQALLHVLGARRGARAASRLQGLGRPIQGQVRRRLGRLSRARLRAPEGSIGWIPQDTEADAARDDHGVVGQHSRRANGRSSAA